MTATWLVPAASRAGQYDVYWCETPDGRNVPAQLDFQYGVHDVAFESTCGQPNGRVMLSLGSNDRLAGALVFARADAPWGVRFLRVEARRDGVLAAPGAPDTSASPFFRTAMVDRANQHTVLEQCSYYTGCFVFGSDQPFMGAETPGAQSVRWEVGCGGMEGGSCAYGQGGASRVQGYVRAIHLVVGDDEPPTGKATTGTALTASVFRGAESLMLDATDWGGGVLDAYATLDGRFAGQIATGGDACTDAPRLPGSRDFTRIQPCALSTQLNLSVDSASIADGEHVFRVFVRDAAFNVTKVIERKIVVDNVPAPKPLTSPAIGAPGTPGDLRPGDKLIATAGSWSGANLTFAYRWQRRLGPDDWVDIAGATGPAYTLTKADIGSRLRVAVIGTNSDGSAEAFSSATEIVVTGATVSVASVAPGAAQSEAAAPQLVFDREQRSVQVRYGAKIVVTGRLVDADAAPIADADVDVFEQVAVVGAPWHKIATIKTDSQGGYVYRPTTTGSRMLRFAYASSRDSGDYRATREVVIAVTAGMDVRAVRRTIPSYGVIRLRGRVLAEPLPAAGTWVEIQVLDAGVWRTVGTRRTAPDGRWSFKHRVRHTSNTTFAFRARLRQLADVPAVESKSTPVKVRVR